MPAAYRYNPIVRTFGRFRAGVVSILDLGRHDVRPETPLNEILPVETRREVWQHLRRQGLRVPELEFSARDRRRHAIAAWFTTLKLALWTQWWPVLLPAFPLVWVASWSVASWSSRHRAVHFPLGLKTVEELVVSMTCFNEHKDSGYRWTRNEIALKVRLIIAEQMGLTLAEVQPELSLIELERMVCGQWAVQS